MKPTSPNFLKLLVPVKRTIDYAVKIRVNSAQTAVETGDVKHSINPFDEIAVEEALRLREKHKEQIESITVATIGPSKAVDVVRHGLAMGADTGIHIQTPDDLTAEPLGVAKVLKKLIEKNQNDLVILGKQAIDDDSSQTGSMLAGLLNWPQANYASSIDLADKSATVSREIDGGIETLNVSLPAIISTDLRLNEPRYASLPNIMKAKKKKVETIKVDDLGVDLSNRIETLKVTDPPKRQGGGKVENVDELVSRLKEAGVA